MTNYPDWRDLSTQFYDQTTIYSDGDDMDNPDRERQYRLANVLNSKQPVSWRKVWHLVGWLAVSILFWCALYELARW